MARRGLVTVCLARDSSTSLYSSCRDTPVLASNGRAAGYAGIYYVNGTWAVCDTRYVLAFLVSGDLVVGRR